jgi:REP element-mobilizing transposase RayT
MSHSHVAVSVHFVFSTKNRVRAITPEIEKRLWAYLAGVARGLGMFVHAVGGYDNHIHLLADLPATRSIANVMQCIKQSSSRYLRELLSAEQHVTWQPGYGAFSVGRSGIARVIRYIRNQREHHRVRTFQEEFLWFLDRHGIPYDPRYIWTTDNDDSDNDGEDRDG